jgi:hypothetical protein
MHPRRLALTASLIASLTLAAPGVNAGERHDHDHGHDDDHRQYGAHVHGIAALNLALEGKEVHLELASPAANIVGFEHAPSSEADHAALDKAVALLKDGDALFRFNAEAGCRMEKADVTSALLDDEHKHDDHGHEAYEGETHSDIDAVYHFECGQPARLTELTVTLFEAFPGMEELNVQYVIENRQGAADLTPADHVVKF